MPASELILLLSMNQNERVLAWLKSRISEFQRMVEMLEARRTSNLENLQSFHFSPNSDQELPDDPKNGFHMTQKGCIQIISEILENKLDEPLQEVDIIEAPKERSATPG
jgi:hypothetical protein